MDHQKVTTKFAKDHLPEWCERCNQQGVYFVDDATSPYLVIHKKCGHEALSTWCPNCETGFALPNKSGSRPSEWTCPTCKTKYPLENSVFQKPIDLYLKHDLPDDVRSRVFPRRHKRASQVEKSFRKLFTFISFAGLIILASLHLLFLIKGVRYTEIEAIVDIVFIMMIPRHGGRLGFGFRPFPWHGKIVPVVILLYALVYLFTAPFGALNQLPADLREISVYHQAIFLQSIFIGGYAFACYYWSYTN